jgi:hypothetical protein
MGKKRDEVRTHFTWSIEHPTGECPFCGGKTVLVVASSFWEPDYEATVEAVGQERYDNEFRDGVTVNDELSGHFCSECSKLVSLSLNTTP